MILNLIRKYISKIRIYYFKNGLIDFEINIIKWLFNLNKAISFNKIFIMFKKKYL